MSKNELKKFQLYTLRDTSDLYPTCVYSADGHTFDAEVEHPLHGNPFKPEITTVIDVYTRKIVGWSVGLSENSLGVLDALSKSILDNGIPLIWYVDKGKGFNNDLQENKTTGFLTRLGINKQNSIPRNSQARGVCERIHKTIWVEQAKTLPTYIGKDMDAEASTKMHHLVRRQVNGTGSSRFLLQWDDFKKLCNRAVDEYNNRPHSSLPRSIDMEGNRRHLTPNEMWETYLKTHDFVPDTVSPEEAVELFRQHVVRRVRRGIVSFIKNEYSDLSLEAYHGQDVAVGFDINDANRVFVREIEGGREGGEIGRLICIARWNAHASSYFPVSFVEHTSQKRVADAVKRRERDLLIAKAELNPSLIAYQPQESTNRFDFLSDYEKEIVYAEAEKLASADVLSAEAPKPINTAERPTFSDEISYCRWILDNADKMTAEDRVYLKNLLKNSSYRMSLEMEGMDVTVLRGLAA